MVASVPELTKRTSSRQRRFEFGGRAEAQAVRGGLLHGFDHVWMRVTEDHRTPGTDVIDEAPAVGGKGVRSRGSLEKDRLTADAAKGANRRIDTAGNVLAGFLV
jgi:hypothetical protein